MIKSSFFYLQFTCFAATKIHKNRIHIIVLNCVYFISLQHLISGRFRASLSSLRLFLVSFFVVFSRFYFSSFSFLSSVFLLVSPQSFLFFLVYLSIFSLLFYSIFSFSFIFRSLVYLSLSFRISFFCLYYFSQSFSFIFLLKFSCLISLPVSILRFHSFTRSSAVSMPYLLVTFHLPRCVEVERSAEDPADNSLVLHTDLQFSYDCEVSQN